MVDAPESGDTRARRWLCVVEWTADPETEGASRGGKTVYIEPRTMCDHP
ncbi:hypothetical protein VSR69_38745 [Paraburkholderia phytofirmans]